MVRAAEAAGLASFAFTEHVFHLEEARAASRYLGTRWDGELEGPPIGVERYLAEIAAAAAAVPAVTVTAGLELEHWPDDAGVREVQDAFIATHAERLGHRDRLGALPERRPFDLRRVHAALGGRGLGRLPRAPRRRRRARRLRRRDASDPARGQPPRRPLRPRRPSRPAGRARGGERHAARGQRLRRARLPRSRAAAVRVDRPRRGAGQPRARMRTIHAASAALRPASSGCAPQGCARRSRSSTAAGATSRCDPGAAALGSGAARVRHGGVRRSRSRSW